ncbi:MAG: hypothetical protein CMJ81_18020 [Planctomycetaceae bacterium]|nr:hypothetical protein [Planctomycetaceae bacterium]MBP60031.1 hypothetical protein [Planctomycetaceae bacterium]
MVYQNSLPSLRPPVQALFDQPSVHCQGSQWPTCNIRYPGEGRLFSLATASVRNAPVFADKRDVVANALEACHHFTFATPSVTQLSDGTIVAAFYVTEEHVTYARCCRMMEG